jgi:hypothetical protein
LPPAFGFFFSVFSAFSFFASFGLVSACFAAFTYTFSTATSFLTSGWGKDFSSGFSSSLASSSFLDFALKLPKSSPVFSASCLVYFPI